MGKCLFVTGTGTDVGKTYVTALIVKKLREGGKNAGYYKAAISGAEKMVDGALLPGDAYYVNEVANIGEKTQHLVSYVYSEAVSPHLAAKIQKKPIEFRKIAADFSWAKNHYDYLTMEGSGGIICPLRWDEQEHMILDDLIKKLGLSVLIVAEAGLGTINAAVLTVSHLKSRQIPIKGIILNRYHPGDVMENDNLLMIEAMTGVRVVAKVKENETELDINVEELARFYE